VSTALAAAMAKSDLNEYIGDIGPYQWRVFAVVFLFTIYCTDSIQIIFLGAELPHWCRVPALDDLPHHVQKNVAIPAVQYSRAEITRVRVFILFFLFYWISFSRHFPRFSVNVAYCQRHWLPV